METRSHRGRTILKEGRIKVLEIPEHLSAEIAILDGENASEENCYLILVDYLSGCNVTHRPVNLRAAIEQSAGDQWVLAQPADAEPVRTKLVVRFIFPEPAPKGYFPAPNDPRLILRTIAPARSANIWFAGIPSDRNIAKHAEILQTFVAKRNLASSRSISEPELGVERFGLFGMLTEVSMPLSVRPARSRLQSDRQVQGSGYRPRLVRTP